MQFLEKVKSQKKAVADLGAQPLADASIDNAANLMPTSKTLVHSLRASNGVRPLTFCWQLTNSRASLCRPRVPHEVRAVGFSCSNAPTILCFKPR